MVWQLLRDIFVAYIIISLIQEWRDKSLLSTIKTKPFPPNAIFFTTKHPGLWVLREMVKFSQTGLYRIDYFDEQEGVLALRNPGP